MTANESSRRGKDGLDNPKIVGTKRRSSLRVDDDRIHELRDFYLTGSPAKLNLRLDAPSGQIAIGQPHILGGDSLALQIGWILIRAIVALIPL